MTSVWQKNNARRKECTVREHATCRPATLDATEVSFVMSASKISSTDGSLKVSSAGTTKKNMEGQMNEKDWRPQPGKWCGGKSQKLNLRRRGSEVNFFFCSQCCEVVDAPKVNLAFSTSAAQT